VDATHRQLQGRCRLQRRYTVYGNDRTHYCHGFNWPGFGLLVDLAEWRDAVPIFAKDKRYRRAGNWIIVRGLTVYVSSASIFRTLVKTIDDRLVFANVRAVQLMSDLTADDFRDSAAFPAHQHIRSYAFIF
jgi:hypothetical protein